MSEYDGMTVNERLFVAGLGEEFHQVLLAGDRNVMVRCLVAAEVDAEEAARTTDTMLANPTKWRVRKMLK